MKNIKIIGFLFFGFTLSGCFGGEDDGFEPKELKYSNARPLLMDTNALFKSINFGPAKTIQTRGPVYVNGNNLFIIDPFLGIHFYNNSDPTHPVEIGFLNVPGCTDLSVMGNNLYVNNAVDMVLIDISNPFIPVVGKRFRNVFPQPSTPDGYPLLSQNSAFPANTVIVGWQ